MFDLDSNPQGGVGRRKCPPVEESSERSERRKPPVSEERRTSYARTQRLVLAKRNPSPAAMLKGSDKISEFPTQFNKLEEQVEKLSENTRGIKFATWITALSTVALAIIAFLTLVSQII